MSRNKYQYQIEQSEDNKWSASITRKITSKKTIVSKQQDGFTTEKEAQEWSETELKAFMENQQALNTRRAKRRN